MGVGAGYTLTVKRFLMSDKEIANIIDERFRDAAEERCDISDLYDAYRETITRIYCSGKIYGVDLMCYISFAKEDGSEKVYLNWE